MATQAQQVEAKTRKYTVLSGAHSRREGMANKDEKAPLVIYRKGDVVELTDGEAAALGPRFVAPVDVEKK